MAHRVLRNLQAGRPEGKTLVFQGAPGAGKTALLNHLREALRGECDTAELDSAQINRPHIALLEVLQEIEPDKADEIKRSYQHTFKGGAKAVVGAGASYATTTPSQEVSTVRELMRQREEQSKPLLLFLDEAQTAAGDLPNGKSSILPNLHAGNARNVALIAGGLSDSEATFNRLGVSRFGSESVRTLQPLDEENVLDALDAFLANNAFGIECDGYDMALRQLVVDESFGWPQHLTNVLRSLGEELIKVGGRLAECDLHAIQQASQARREDYYARRINTIPSPLLHEVISVLPKGQGTTSYTVLSAVERAYKTHPLIEKELPYDDAYDALLHCGVLQKDTIENLTVPIPSMHDYITERTHSLKQGAPSSSDLGW